MTLALILLSLFGFVQQPVPRGFEAYLDGFVRHSDVHADSALFYAKKMLEAAHRENDEYKILRAEYALGYTYRFMNDYPSAIDHYRKSWLIARAGGYEEREIMATNGLGMALYRAGNYRDALRYLYMSLFIRKKRNEAAELSTIYNNIGLVYLKLWNWQKAHDFFTLALKNKERYDQDDAPVLVNLAVCLPNMGRIEEAHEKFRQFREVCGEDCSPGLWCDYYNAFGGLYLNQRDAESANIYFKKALQLATEHGLQAHKEMAYDNLATAEKLAGRRALAMDYADSAIRLAISLNMPQRIQNNYRQLAELNELLERPADALAQWNKYDSMRQLISGEEVLNQIYSDELEWLEQAYEDELALREARILSIRRTNLVVIGLSLALCFLAFLWWLNYRRKKQALEALRNTQDQLVRQEKMAALGSLMAGIAHELNNPLSAALSSYKSALRHSNELGAFSGSEAQILPPPVTGLERRRAREGMLATLAGHPVRDQIVEQMLDLGMTEISPEWQEIIENDATGELVKKMIGKRMAEKDLLRIGRSLENMQGVIRSLQESSRSGTGEYVLTEVDVAESIDAVLILLHNQLKYNVEVERRFPDEKIRVRANPQRLSQVWMNLLTNALQAMPEEGGRIVIRIDHMWREFIRVEVRDNGSGISTDDQAMIFDKFYTTRYVTRGNGLGLFIVRSILNEIQGSVHFVSSVSGTAMSVFLQRA